jgi:predicted XRE-type DNA-binding protein
MKTKPFRELYDKFPAEVRKRNQAWVREQLQQMPLNELRQARKLTQETIAETLAVEQASISKMERRADMYISTLRKFIEAMGGKLQVRACFPDGDVEIVQLAEDKEPAGAAFRR